MLVNNESYIGRRAAAEKYRRGERTLERDISQALKVRNDEFLDSIRLRTKEGDLLPGTDVTFEKIDDLKNAGQVPTWEIAETYLTERYGLRSEEPSNKDRSQQPREELKKGIQASQSPTNSPGNVGQTHTASETDLPPLPRDPVEQAALLRALYQNLQRSFQVERDRNDKIFALIETIPKQQEQTNILLREFQELMKSGSASPSLHEKSDVKAQPVSQVVEVQTIEVNKPSNEPVPKRAKSFTTKKQERRKPIRNKKTKKRSSAKASKPAKKNKASSTPPTFVERHLPSLTRMFGSRSSKKR